jgi:hypothetical protein
MCFVFVSLSPLPCPALSCPVLQEQEASQPWTAVYAEAVVLSGAGTKVTAIRSVLAVVLRSVVKVSQVSCSGQSVLALHCIDVERTILHSCTLHHHQPHLI